jgi:hypothetical protein
LIFDGISSLWTSLSRSSRRLGWRSCDSFESGAALSLSIRPDGLVA